MTPAPPPPSSVAHHDTGPASLPVAGTAAAGRDARSAPLRAWVLPVVLATLVLLLLAVTPWASGGYLGLWGDVAWYAPVGWALYLGLARVSVVAGVVLARRLPRAALGLVAWPFLALPVIGIFEWGWWLALLAVSVVTAVDGWRRAVLPLAATLAVAAVYVWSGVPAMLPIGPVNAVSSGGEDLEWTGFTMYAIASVAAVAVAAAVGASGRARRRSTRAAAESRRALEVESVAGERARIARDLHDVVAHHVSLVAVRAESAPYTHPEIGEAALPVLADIAADARRALDELRQVLVVLQRSAGTEDLSAPLAPQPGGPDIRGLVDAARAAGQQVTLLGDADDLDPARGYVLFRAAQEALTNARRHAPGRPVEVRLDGTAGTVAGLVVTNPTVGAPGPAGRGLLGMRERVEALGGELTTMAHDGSFVVSVSLPARPAPQDGAPRVATTGQDES